MKLQQDIDFNGLGWIKFEIDATLKQAQETLEDFVENTGDLGLMRLCASHLHQVQGALRIVELYGAAMVADEMESLAQAIVDERISEPDDAYAVLLRGIVQLPNYLERVQEGHKDVPVVLLPLLNDLRACRGEKLLSESVLFSTGKLDEPTRELAAEPPLVAPTAAPQERIRRLRDAYQFTLLRWFKAPTSGEHQTRLIAILDRLYSLSMQAESRSLWRVGTAVLEAIRDGALEPSVAVKLLFGKIDREFKRFAEDGEESLSARPPREVMQSLLYYIAHSSAEGPRVSDVRRIYRLQSSLPTLGEVQQAEGAMSGHNRTLLNTVSGAIKEDLLRVKEMLDMFLRTRDADPATLLEPAESLDRIGDTLGMLGLGIPRRMLEQQRLIIEEMGSGRGTLDDARLLDVAGALLVVETTLDDHIDRLGSEEDLNLPLPGELELPKAEVRKLLEALMREAASNVQQVKHDIVAFIESPWDHARVEPIPHLLEEIIGALTMLDLGDAAEAMTGILRFVDRELLGRHVVPTATQMDRLADAMSSIEYYLDATREQRAGRDQILLVTQGALSELDYWPVPAADLAQKGRIESARSSRSQAAQVDADDETAESRDRDLLQSTPVPAWLGDMDDVTGQKNVAQPTSAPSETPPLASVFTQYGFVGDADSGIDDEIRDVYLEEVDEEIAALDSACTVWLAAPDQLSLLAPIRRSFHTLKGSGRLVGAGAIAEFGWTVESILNRVLEGTLVAGAEVQAFAKDSIAILPSLAAALRSCVAPEVGVSDLVRRAQQLGGSAPQRAAPISSPVVAVVDETESVLAQSADDTVTSRSEQSDIDPALLEILTTEMTMHVAVIDGYLEGASRSPVPVTDDLLRAVHTLNGAVAMVDVPALSSVLAPAEGYLRRLRSGGLAADAAGLAALQSIADLVRQARESLRNNVALPLDSTDLAPALIQMRDALPEQMFSHEVDADESGDIDAELQDSDSSGLDFTSEFASTFGNDELDDAVSDAGEGESDADAEAILDELVDELEGLMLVDDVPDAKSADEVDESDEASRALLANDADNATDLTPRESTAAGTGEESATADSPVDSFNLDDLLVEQPDAVADGLVVTDDQTALEHADLNAAVPAQPVVREDDEPSDPAPAMDVVEIGTMLEMPDIDDELLEVFLQEAGELLDHCDGVMANLHRDQDESDSLSALQRDLHTLKGGARMAGLAPIGDLGHAMETLLERVQDGDRQFDSHAADALQNGFDTLHQMVQRVSQRQPIALPVVALARLERGSQRSFELPTSPRRDGQSSNAEEVRSAVTPTISVPESSENPGDAVAAAGTNTPSTSIVEDPNVSEADSASSEISATEHAALDTDTVADADVTTDGESPDEVVIGDPVAEEPVVDTSAAGDVDASEVDIVEAETDEAETDEAETAEAETAEAETAEAETDEAETDEAETDEAETAEAETVEAETVEAETVEAETVEAETVEAETAEAETAEAETAEAETAEAETAEAETAEAETVEAETAEGETAEAETAEAETDEAETGESETAEAETVEAETAEAETAEAETDEAETDEAEADESETDEADTAEIDNDEADETDEIQASTAEVGVDEDGESEAMDSSTGDVHAQALSDTTSPVPAPNPPLPSIRTAAPPPPLSGTTLADELPRTQEMIRVRSDLLDSLVNFAGEVSIYRSRLDQQNASFRFNLVEFDQTITRLRDQLRKFEMETEMQIVSRYEREQGEAQNESKPVFDPLELDRFSQLQQYSRSLAESVSDLVSIQNLLEDLTRQSEGLLQAQARVGTELQDGLMRTRMVPFESLVPTLRRTLRQAAMDVGKRAQLKVEGAQGEMDRNLLERMKAPFEHMLRNALAHAFETPEERVKAGKPDEGSVTIAVSRDATEVVLRVSDDGRGLNAAAIRQRAIERGLMKPDQDLVDRDIYPFILESGFSTSTEVTKLAGRGVGMDVVHNEIKQLGGSLNIESRPGLGTDFSIRLPFTLAVTQAIVVKLGGATYAVPMTSVQGVSRIERDELQQHIDAASPQVPYSGEQYDIYDLANLLDIPPGRAPDDLQVPLLMTRTGNQRAAVRVDSVTGSREVVVKSVGPQVSSIPGIFGATIMGDGSVVMILDLAPLVRRAAAKRLQMEESAIIESLQLRDAIDDDAAQRPKLVMVVDDSITVRKVTQRVLERADFEVVTAKDGVDAVEKLQERTPDVMLLDIEMPRMDGYELASYMKNDSRLRGVPIIMITSRTGEKHRQRALEIGVERYLGKPYQETDLLRQVHEMLEAGRE